MSFVMIFDPFGDKKTTKINVTLEWQQMMEKQHATHHKEIPLMEAIIEPLMATIKYIFFGSHSTLLFGEKKDRISV